MKDFKKYIKDVANDHQEQVDNDALWAGIQAKMKTPKKKRRILPFFLWGSCILLPMAAAIGLFLWQNKTHRIHHVDGKPDQVITTKNFDNSLIESESSTLDQTSNQETQPIQENKSTIAKIEKRKNTAPSKNLNNPEISIPSKESSFELNNNNQKNNSIFQQFDNSIPLELSESKKETVLSEKPHAHSDRLMENMELERSILSVEWLANTIDLVHDREDIDIPKVMVDLPILPSQRDEQFSLLNSVTLYTQYGRGSKTSSGEAAYAAIKNNSEELLEQVRIGIESDLVRLLDFTLYGGASYVSINDRVNTDEAFYEDREITYLKSVIVSAEGNEVEQYATENLPHQINKKSVRHNSHRFISLPVGLRFGKKLSDIHFGIGFGLDFNYYFADNHEVLNRENRLTTVAVGGRWESPSLHTALSIDYPIAERWFLHSKLMYRSTKFENEVSESYQIYGVDLGLRLRF